jgi:hypothetical protein
VVISDCVSIVLDVVIDDLTVVWANSYRPFCGLFVLQRRPRLWAMSKIEAHRVSVEVSDIERTETTKTNPRVPEDAEDDVISAGVGELFEMVKDPIRPCSVDVLILCLVFWSDIRDMDAFTHSGLDGLNARTELKEHAECLKLAT